MMGSGSLFSNGLNGFCGERKQMSRCGHQPCTPVAPQLHPAPLNSRKRGHKSLRPRGYRRASFAARSPSSDLWLHEIKHDGFRDRQEAEQAGAALQPAGQRSHPGVHGAMR
jgi:hypothetical protein